MDKIGDKNLVVYAEQKRWLIVAWLQILGNCNTKYLRHPDSIFSTTQVHCELLWIFSSRCVHHIASWNFIIQMLLYSRRRKTLPDKASGPRSVRRAFKFLRPGWWVMHLALKKKKKKSFLYSFTQALLLQMILSVMLDLRGRDLFQWLDLYSRKSTRIQLHFWGRRSLNPSTVHYSGILFI